MKINNRGFSLAELIVASGIGVVLAGIATFSFVEAMNMFNRSIRQYTAEADMIGAMYNIKSLLSQATQVNYGGEVSDGTGGTNGYSARTYTVDPTKASLGRLYRYPGLATSTGVYLIAVGTRELKGRLSGFGIYYQKQETATSGALYFDMETNTGGAAGTVGEGEWAMLSPRNASIAYGRFTEFKVENIRALNTADGTIVMDAGASEIDSAPVLGAEFVMSMRYYTRGAVSSWKWCPKALVAGTPACIGNNNYYDIEKRLKVNFANNALSDSHLPTRAYGNLFFFHSVPPASRR
jgi:prepilin-type N-terminal cleavage/methylation domain-containing protein